MKKNINDDSGKQAAVAHSTKQEFKNMLLKIARRYCLSVESLGEARAVYCRLRDESGEGASSFPDGKIVMADTTLRISYNGRIWNGQIELDLGSSAEPSKESNLMRDDLLGEPL